MSKQTAALKRVSIIIVFFHPYFSERRVPHRVLKVRTLQENPCQNKNDDRAQGEFIPVSDLQELIVWRVHARCRTCFASPDPESQYNCGREVTRLARRR